jgi:uncharacterized SAM-binding protein YcdF (DUF218 family)
MEFAKRSIEFIFSPFGMVILLLVAGVLFCLFSRHSRAGRRFLFCGSLLFLIITLSPLAIYLVWNLERPFPPLLKPPTTPKIEKIVILAGYAEEGPGIPVTSSVSEQTVASLSEGLRLHRLLPNAKLIVSGGVAEEGKRSVAAVMADFLQELGAPKESLIIEGNSKNTYENLREVKNLAGTEPFILVASGCDLRRAVAVAKKLQMNPIPAPAYIWTLQRQPINWTLADWAANYFKNRGYISLKSIARLQWAYHEYVGYLWYSFLERI